ncbi:MAG: YARHG domain-containing protein [Alphaproteobacteria bacterium]|nr:YARHG domain-containing protein [Alphaproteobacteria bacterium]
MLSKALFLAAGILASGLLVAGGVRDAQAQAGSPRYMSCDELWYARNEIYAENGYCFKTRRARSVFGRGCFPPYGRLSPREQRRVSEIERWEYRKGCR